MFTTCCLSSWPTTVLEEKKKTELNIFYWIIHTPQGHVQWISDVKWQEFDRQEFDLRPHQLCDLGEVNETFRIGFLMWKMVTIGPTSKDYCPD